MTPTRSLLVLLAELAVACAQRELPPHQYGYMFAPIRSPTALIATGDFCLRSARAGDGRTSDLDQCAPEVEIPAGSYHLLVGAPRRHWPKHWFALRVALEAGKHYELRARDYQTAFAPSECVVSDAIDSFPQRVVLTDLSTSRDVAQGGHARREDYALHKPVHGSCGDML